MSRGFSTKDFYPENRNVKIRGLRVPVLFYTYRVDMQLRGMAHIHGFFWLDEKFLQNSSLLSEAELITCLNDNFITCELPSEDDPLRQKQTHHHTKS